MLQSAPQSSGAEFDAWFVAQTVAEHLKAIALFTAAANMKDADLAAFAKKSLPALMNDRKSAPA